MKKQNELTRRHRWIINARGQCVAQILGIGDVNPTLELGESQRAGNSPLDVVAMHELGDVLSAAPELLAALTRAEKHLDFLARVMPQELACAHVCAEVAEQARAALAKARGGERGEPEPEAAEPLARIGQFMGGKEVAAT